MPKATSASKKKKQGKSVAAGKKTAQSSAEGKRLPETDQSTRQSETTSATGLVQKHKVTEKDLEQRSQAFVRAADSFWAIVFTSISYVMNDLRKKKRQFAIGISTIFITVSVVTFLDSLIGLAPAVTLIASQSTVGDFDIQLSKRSEKDYIANGNKNLFIDKAEAFRNARNKTESFHELMLSKSRSLPFLNYTQLNLTLSDIEREGSEVSGRFFPRWNALSKVINPASNKTTSAIMVAGDSQLENEIGVANGFPDVDLKHNEVIMLQDVLDVLSLQNGDTVEIHFDIFQTAVSDLAKLKKILFDFENYKRLNKENKGQGEAIMDLLKIDVNQQFIISQYFNSKIFDDLSKRINEGNRTTSKTEFQQMSNILIELMRGKGQIKISEILDKMIPFVKESDFILKKEYTIVGSAKTAFGKWPQTYGNAYFTDSKFLVQDLFEAFKDNSIDYLKRNDFPEKDQILNSKLIDLLLKNTEPSAINNFALSIMGHLDDRMNSYIYQKKGFDIKLNQIFRQISLSANITNETPIVTNMEAQNVIEFMLNNVLATVIFFVCLLSFILIFSLMQTDVEERKYEFAVLRTLGMRNRSLITLITVQSLFFSIPGIILGFVFMMVLVFVTQLTLNNVAQVNVEVVVQTRTVIMGVVIGLFIPFLSNIVPIKQALRSSLRNALDKMRPSLDDLEVEMVRFENSGISFNQIMMSITLLCCGIITYYYIPQAAAYKDFQGFLYLLNVLLLLIILGLTFLAQLLVPFLEVALLDFFLFFSPNDRKMRSLVVKNFESHANKNLKASMMFMVTLAFLVFTGANFKQIEFFLVSMSKFFAGANITAQKIDFGQDFQSTVSLDELKIKDFLERKLIRNDPNFGVIEEYGFQTQSLVDIMDHKWSLQLKQAGVDKDQCVDIYGIDGSTLNSIDMEFYHPGQHIEDPIGIGRKYKTEDITRMLEDLEDYSTKSNSSIDKKNVLFERLKRIEDQDETIYNIVVAECLRGVVFNEVGDYVNICLKLSNGQEASSITNRGTDYRQCFTKAKARVVATSRKFPGFFKFSGYKQVNLLCPDIVMTKRQMRTLIKDTLKHFPHLENDFLKKVQDQYPASTEDLPKSKLYVKVGPNISRQARNNFKNDLLNYINDENIYIFDSFSFSADIKSRMVILQVLNTIISLICYVMGLFQLVLTIQANIRDSQWELGVLRSMGMNKTAILKLTVYESVSNNLASILCGFIIGLLVSIGSIGQFLLFLELPFKVVLPYDIFVVVTVLSILTMSIGCWLGARELYRKEIASTLKGL